MARDELLNRIRSRLEASYGERLRGVILYGSEAREEAAADSDVDVVVLLDGPIEMGRELRRIIEAIYPLQLEGGFFRPIHAVPVDVRDYTAQVSTFCRQVREQGIVV